MTIMTISCLTGCNTSGTGGQKGKENEGGQDTFHVFRFRLFTDYKNEENHIKLSNRKPLVLLQLRRKILSFPVEKKLFFYLPATNETNRTTGPKGEKNDPPMDMGGLNVY
jgi:hypothetical protein